MPACPEQSVEQDPEKNGEQPATEPAAGTRRKRRPESKQQYERRLAREREQRARLRSERPALHRFTLQQQRFIYEYLAVGQAAEAARRAGYRDVFAADGAYRFLRRPDVAAVIAAEREAIQQRSQVTLERVVGELAKIAFADPRDLFTADGRLKPIHELDEMSAASIAAIDVLTVAGSRRQSAGGAAKGTRSRSASNRSASSRTASSETSDDAVSSDDGGDVVLELRKIKRWDKTKALELLGRYLGLFKDRIEVGVAADLANTIEAARKRSQALRQIDLPAIDASVIDGNAQVINDAEPPAGDPGNAREP